MIATVINSYNIFVRHFTMVNNYQTIDALEFCVLWLVAVASGTFNQVQRVQPALFDTHSFNTRWVGSGVLSHKGKTDK
jgi:hypothetical protein